MTSYQTEPTIEAFGAKLLASGDLDPLYIALHHTFGATYSPDRQQLRRWLFAYWCCYHAGASSWLSELSGSTYWTWMRIMAENSLPTPLKDESRWPRGHERRHFRGEKAIKAIEHYAEKWPTPESICVWFEDVTLGQRFADLRQKVITLPQFGPWIAFKVGDMLERVSDVPIDFADSDVMMFDSPRQAAILVGNTWSEHLGPPKAFDVRSVSQTLIQSFNHRLAPPRFDRPVNIQEVETILCKWKSHLNGHYPVGFDTIEIRNGLTEWSKVSKTAERLREALPR